jgi:hypothetical protein
MASGSQIRHNGKNRLKSEKSPYLIQHAHNPVDWYPWGEEAFEQARRDDKPVLVSVGYSTCHWCHVMAEESFEDPEIADLMNRFLISVKVDREERPDIDNFLITAVSSLSGSAGWPLNVFLTPEGLPFFGGTYFPPRSRRYMPGWADVIHQVHKAWSDPAQRARIEDSAQSVNQQLKRLLSYGEGAGETELSIDVVERAVDAYAEDYDQENGGFGSAPKFPMPSIYSFLIAYGRFCMENGGPSCERSASTLRMVSGSLDAMARGGIYDHIGGGFHRYATDAQWFLPHFEKMLYDNAQLIRVYAEAYDMFGAPAYETVARESIDYVLRDMTHPEGGFFSAEDADSVPPDAEAETGEKHPPRREGAFYVWKKSEIEEILNKHPDKRAAAVFCHTYGVREQGNVSQDTFGEFEQQNVLHPARGLEAVAARFDRPAEEVRKLLEECRQMIFEARGKRQRPHLDDKVLSSWNALMISALAKAYRVFGIPEYLAAAGRAADFLERHLYDATTGDLFRRWREDEADIRGQADDYAFLAEALLDLYEAGFSAERLQWAIDLMEVFVDRFVDPETGGVYLTPQSYDPFLAVRMKDAIDNVTPSAASVAARNLVRLFRLTGGTQYETALRNVFRSCADQIERFPKMAPYLLRALLLSRAKHVHMVIAASSRSAELAEMIETGRRKGGMGQSMVLVSGDSERDELARILPETGETAVPEDGVSAQVCHDRSCRRPVNTKEEFGRQLEAAFE